LPIKVENIDNPENPENIQEAEGVVEDEFIPEDHNINFYLKK